MFVCLFFNRSPKPGMIGSLTREDELGKNKTKVCYVFIHFLKMDFLSTTAPKTVVVTKIHFW